MRVTGNLEGSHSLANKGAMIVQGSRGDLLRGWLTPPGASWLLLNEASDTLLLSHMRM